jgi:Domain of unknown function (DUF4349)
MRAHREDDLAAALRALRPDPRPEFAAELDARAALGFPRRAASNTPDAARIGPRARLLASLSRLREAPPRRRLAAAGAAGLVAIVAATAVIAGTGGGAGESGSTTIGPVPGGGEAGGAGLEPKPAPESAAESASGASAGGSSSAAGVEMAPATTHAAPYDRTRAAGPYASHRSRRDVERSASIVLGADPSEVRADSAKVFEAVHATNGIVLRSSIRDGSAGEAGASFDLLIPAARLSDALAAFSAIDEVRSRHESTADITAPTIGAGERLRDSRARIESLLTELAAADTAAERSAVEAELRAERRRAAVLRSRLAGLRRRANLSRVSLRIETGRPAAGGGTGGWGIGDGLASAGRVLAIAAGVAIVGLALLAPLAVLALLAWLAHRAWLRRARGRALGRA